MGAILVGRELMNTIGEAGSETDFEWCPGCGQLDGVSAPLGKTLSWTHNGDRLLTAFLYARANSTSYAYGLAGEKTSYTFSDSSTYTLKYDNCARFKSIKSKRSRRCV